MLNQTVSDRKKPLCIFIIFPMILKSPISIYMKEKPTEARVSWQPLFPALEVWMLVELNFGADSSALLSACPVPTHSL